MLSDAVRRKHPLTEKGAHQIDALRGLSIYSLCPSDIGTLMYLPADFQVTQPVKGVPISIFGGRKFSLLTLKSLPARWEIVIYQFVALSYEAYGVEEPPEANPERSRGVAERAY